MTHIILADRDGTLIQDNHYISSIAQVEIIPNVHQAIRTLEFLDLEIFVVSNQSGIGRGYFHDEQVHSINHFIQSELDPQKKVIKGFMYCPHLPSDNCQCRKPQSGMYDAVVSLISYCPTSIHVIGDRLCDIQFGQNINAFTYHVATGKGLIDRNEVSALTPASLCSDFSHAVRMIINSI